MAINALGAAPATKPSDVTDKQLTQWISSLDDRGPGARASASASLMLLTRDDLPRLRSVVLKVSPLSPAQLGVLHDVVVHVFLSGEPYDKGMTGFLGMRLYPFTQFGLDPRVVGQGIVVESRMAGFGAYRSLLDGDAILAIQEFPDTLLTDSATFIQLVKQCRPGTELHMEILRQGHRVTVPVIVDARPTDMRVNNGDPDSIEDFNDDRLMTAEKYWQRQFAPIAGDVLSQVD